ncbi:MAG: HAD family hydrolase [Clostridia bacterium]|nr:HAD family hydrolase [Clostridia bacterium]MDE7328866.1 HAD family hydrolase [Clostridia bacterium]
MNKQKIIAFDLDGTVLDTLPDIATAANFALKSLGFPEQSLESVRTYIGRGIRNLLKDLMGCDDEEVLENCRSIFKDYYDKNKSVTTKPYDGIIDLLNALKQKGYLLYLISNKYEFATKQLVEQFFAGVFDGVYGSLDDRPAKPDRAIFDYVCDIHGLSKDGIIYVGDSEVDYEFAKNCGMEFIAVSWGFRTRSQLENLGVKVIADSVKELADLLNLF